MPTASHSLRIQSAKSSIIWIPSPFTAAAIPMVPGQAAKTPEASFIPKTTSPFSFLELDTTITGIKCSPSSARLFISLIQSASSSGFGLLRRIKVRTFQSLMVSVVPTVELVAKIEEPFSTGFSSKSPVSSTKALSSCSIPIFQEFRKRRPIFSSADRSSAKALALSSGDFLQSL